MHRYHITFQCAAQVGESRNSVVKLSLPKMREAFEPDGLQLSHW